MSRTQKTVYGLARVSRFPLSLFAVIFGGLMLASGVHEGLIILVGTWTDSGIVLVHLVLVPGFPGDHPAEQAPVKIHL